MGNKLRPFDCNLNADVALGEIEFDILTLEQHEATVAEETSSRPSTLEFVPQIRQVNRWTPFNLLPEGRLKKEEGKKTYYIYQPACDVRGCTEGCTWVGCG